LLHYSSPTLEGPTTSDRIDTKNALATLNTLLGVEGLSGREGAVANEITRILRAAGLPKRAIRHDQAQKKIPGYEVGNLLVNLPGTRKAKPWLFMTHMDTVPLCAGAVPVRRGGRIVPKGKTALGGDNRTGCAALVTMVQTLLERELDHPPLTLLFTVGEEAGLYGARHVTKKDLGPVEMGFNVDGGAPANITIGAIGANEWRVDVTGIASHAGVYPHEGVSAAAITALALEQVHRTGWFGRVIKGNRRGSSNVGRIDGGAATNEVTGQMVVTGECRSHSAAFLEKITEAYARAFEKAARTVKTHDGKRGSAVLTVVDGFPAFRMSKTSPVVRHAVRAAKSIGLEAGLKVGDGGLDATWLNLKDVPTITFGAGQHKPHSLGEHIEVAEFLDGCRLAVALATG